jgi:hypothetical protein
MTMKNKVIAMEIDQARRLGAREQGNGHQAPQRERTPCLRPNSGPRRPRQSDSRRRCKQPNSARKRQQMPKSLWTYLQTLLMANFSG